MNLIACVDSNWAIGYKNELLVKIPSDQKFFRETTTGKVVVLGRKTRESFPGGQPLKDRVNIVLSRCESLQRRENEIIVNSMTECLEELKKYPDEDIFIIGGSSVYQQFLPYCNKAYITQVDREFSADVYFPNLAKNPEWKLVCESEEQTYFDNTFVYLTYERIS